MTTLPAVTRGRLRAELAEAQREQHRRRYEADPWAWICETVSTIDEMDARTPIKPPPVSACVPCRRYVGWADREACPQCGGTPKPLAYLEHLTRVWHLADPPIHRAQVEADDVVVAVLRVAHVAGALSPA
jgi:hypothetical protein